eukprot:6477434-Amphidinium_carterae.1
MVLLKMLVSAMFGRFHGFPWNAVRRGPRRRGVGVTGARQQLSLETPAPLGISMLAHLAKTQLWFSRQRLGRCTMYQTMSRSAGMCAKGRRSKIVSCQMNRLSPRKLILLTP